VYMEYRYHSVCPIVGIGSPTPSPSSECGSPTGPEWGGETHSLARGGSGGPNYDEGTNSGIQMYNPSTRKYLFRTRILGYVCTFLLLMKKLVVK
jgi:hypothetical protein